LGVILDSFASAGARRGTSGSSRRIRPVRIRVVAHRLSAAAHG
jgi:hypothetical protein